MKMKVRNKKFTTGRSVPLMVAILVASSVHAGDGSWGVDANGNWSASGNWVGGIVATGVDATASFDMSISGDRVVTVDKAWTVGHLVLRDLSSSYQNWTLQGSQTLTLNVSSNMPTLTGVNAGHTINVPLGGSDGLRITGSFFFEVANTYTGTTVLDNATICLAGGDFSSGPLSLISGRLYANTVTLNNSIVLLDGNFTFGRGSGSYWQDDITFAGPALLTGNRRLHQIQGDGSDTDITFSSGIQDGGNGYSFSISREASPAGIFILGPGSSYSGDTVILGGALRLTGELTSTPEVFIYPGGTLDNYQCHNNRLHDSVPVTLHGGTLQASADYGSWSAGNLNDETVGAVTAEHGFSTFRTSTKRGRTTLQITSLIRRQGAMLYFNVHGTYDVNAGGTILITGQPDGFMGGWAIARDTGSSGPPTTDYDWAWYDGANGVEPMLVNTTRPGQVEGASAGDHVKTASGQSALTADTTMASLAVTAGYDNNLGGYRLDIASGGLLHFGSAYAISNGMLTTSSETLSLFSYDSAMTIDADIVGPCDVTTCGSVVLGGNNTYSGDLWVNAGTLTLNSADSTMRQITVLPSATLQVNQGNAISSRSTLSLEEYYQTSTVDLGADVTVSCLQSNGEYQPKGVYTSTTHPQYFTGSGTLTVLRQGPPKGLIVIIK